MIDFEKLMKRTPEESRAEIERIDAEFRENNLLVISSRQAIIQECSKRIGVLSAWEVTFIDSLTKKAEWRDRISGLIGGELSCLSTTQMSKLSSIHARLSSRPVEDEGVAEPKKKMQYPSSRMRM